MASEPIVEITPFLQPIGGENPAGTDLREQSDPDFATIKTARRKIVSLAKTARFDNSADTDLNEQWKIIRKLAPSILRKKSKDLEVAAWFAESLLKLHGFPGLRDGFAIISELIDNFWDNLYPMPDEDGLETRIYPLISLNGEEGNGTLVLPIRNTSMFPDSDLLLSFTSLTRIRETMKIEDVTEKEAKLAELGVSQQAVQNQLEAVTPAAAASFVDDLNQVLANWLKIGDTVDSRCQQAGSADSFPISGVRSALEEVKELYQQIMRSKLEVAEPQADSPVADVSPVVANSAAEQTQQTTTASPAQSREDAIRQLHAIASYFRQAEPHSPMAGIVERAAQWARLPVSQLMAELIPDASARMHYSLMTGVEIGVDLGDTDQAAPAHTARKTTEPKTPDQPSSAAEWSF